MTGPQSIAAMLSGLPGWSTVLAGKKNAEKMGQNITL
jgi:hypothetical protein